MAKKFNLLPVICFQFEPSNHGLQLAGFALLRNLPNFEFEFLSLLGGSSSQRARVSRISCVNLSLFLLFHIQGTFWFWLFLVWMVLVVRIIRSFSCHGQAQDTQSWLYFWFWFSFDVSGHLESGGHSLLHLRLKFPRKPLQLCTKKIRILLGSLIVIIMDPILACFIKVIFTQESNKRINQIEK